MLDSYCRKPYQSLFVNPLVNAMERVDICPDTITFGALFLGICVAPLMALGASFAAVVFLLLSGYLDTLDGSIARARGLTSERGTVLDIVSDRVVEFSVVMGLFFVDQETRGQLCLLMLGSILLCVTSFLVVGMFTKNDGEKGFHYNPGIVERTEAFAFFIAMILAPSLFVPLAVSFTCLVIMTAVVRIAQFSFPNQ